MNTIKMMAILYFKKKLVILKGMLQNCLKRCYVCQKDIFAYSIR